jgi:hypothetical protein
MLSLLGGGTEKASSRHQDPRTLARYAKPGIEAVAALTAEFERGRRHRQ